MATAKPSLARASARARPMRCAPPVTNAAIGTGRVGTAPVGSISVSTSPAGTAFLSRPHFGAGDIACRHAGASCSRPPARPVGALGHSGGSARRPDRQAEISLLEPSDLIAEPCRFFEFEIRSSLKHAFFEIGDDALEIGALIVGCLALGQTKGDVIALVNALQNIGYTAA